MNEQISERFYVAIGANHWGKGITEENARHSLKRAGYSLSDGYLVYLLPEGAHSVWVDDMGNVRWSGPLGKVELVTKRKGRKTR